MSENANWKLYYIFEEVVYKEDDIAIKKILDQFTNYDYMAMPIIHDLVTYEKIRLLRILHNKGIPFTYEEDYGGNALHVACGVTGSLKCAKFFIENNILTDINKISTKYGDTPLNLAISYNNKDIIEYFVKKFNISSISLKDLEVILDRVKSNFRRNLVR